MKISQVLIDSQNTQTTGNLVRDWDTDGKPKNYCALGVLACEKGIINDISDIGISYEKILLSYGIKDVFMYVKMPRKSLLNKEWGGQTLLLTSCIWKLNDDYLWSFKKIGEYLKKLEDEGIIQYND